MEKRKYIQLLATLTKQELKQFRLYLCAPFFNKKQSILQLFDFIKRFHPEYTHVKLEKKNIYSNIFPNQVYKEQTFRNLMSDSYKLLKGFLIQQRLSKQVFLQEYWLLQTLSERKLDKLYAQKMAALQQTVAAKSIKDVTHYYQQYQIEKEAHNFNVTRRGRVTNGNLQKVIHNLDAYYLANKLRYCCALLNHNSMMVNRTGLYFFDEMLAYIQTGAFDENTIIKIYYHLFLLLKEEHDEVHYNNLKEVLQKHEAEIPLNELQDIYTAMFNYCNKKLKSGQADYLKEIFDWYKIMLVKDSLIIDGYITPVVHFRNIVTAALRLGETQWAATFIEEYQLKIAKEHRQNMVNYCRAALLFFQKDYATALIWLSQFELKDFFYHIEHKILLVKVYYELNEYESLQSLLHAFRVYLLRSTHLSEHLKVSYHNFIRLVEKLLKLKMEGKKASDKLITGTQKLTSISNQDWLLQKIKELVE